MKLGVQLNMILQNYTIFTINLIVYQKPPVKKVFNEVENDWKIKKQKNVLDSELKN